MKKELKKMLNLKGLNVINMESTKEGTFITTSAPYSFSRCPKCQKRTKKIHQWRERKVKHGWFQEKPIMLLLRVRWFKCKRKSCNITFTEKIEGIDSKHHSKNCQKEAVIKLRSSSLKSTGDSLNTSPTTLSRWLVNTVPDAKLRWPKKGDIYLGLDGHSFKKRSMVTTVTELRTRRTITVLPDDKQKTVVAFLKSQPLSVRRRIVAVCIDMDSRLRGAVKKALPHASIVVDKFHLLRFTENVLNEVRKIIQTRNDRRFGSIPRELLKTPYDRLSDGQKEKLREIFRRYEAFPSLYAAWSLKEKVRKLYQCDSYNAAKLLYRNILLISEDERIGYVGDLRRTLVRWQPYILNYFKYRITNAYTEGVHNPFKLTKRISFGFRNVKNYIAKIMLRITPLHLILLHSGLL